MHFITKYIWYTSISGVHPAPHIVSQPCVRILQTRMVSQIYNLHGAQARPIDECKQHLHTSHNMCTFCKHTYTYMHTHIHTVSENFAEQINTRTIEHDFRAHAYIQTYIHICIYYIHGDTRHTQTTTHSDRQRHHTTSLRFSSTHSLITSAPDTQRSLTHPHKGHSRTSNLLLPTCDIGEKDL